MNVSLGSLRQRLLDFRAWDSSGATLNGRIREALNTALDRLAGDVPEALIPDKAHVVLLPDVKGSDTDVVTRLQSLADRRVLEFRKASDGSALGASHTWSPTVDGTWDGQMHLEVQKPSGVWIRVQSREWWTEGSGDSTAYYVSIDQPWDSATDTGMDFRIHQPEFFTQDDVMQLLEPVKVWDDTRQQVWGIDTAGAYRQDMIDFRGESKGRPYRMWRGRHFQLPPPRKAPEVTSLSVKQVGGSGQPWVGPVAQGKFKLCYTYVWGRRPQSRSPEYISDPMWESAPSPVTAFDQKNYLGDAIRIRGVNIDHMMGYDVVGTTRETRTGMRLRFYIAREDAYEGTVGETNVESAGIFYLLTEVDPATVSPTGSFDWDGSTTPDYQRPLKHSTGYFAWQVYPHQDARYVLDLRVLRLPAKFIDDQDTAPIQRDAVSALIELSLYYMCLLDGGDQAGATMHLDRYEQLARRYRHRYSNPGGIVEPTPLGGFTQRIRYGTFSSS